MNAKAWVLASMLVGCEAKVVVEPAVSEHRCDHEAVRAFTLDCISRARCSNAGDADHGVVEECESVASRFFCEWRKGKNGADGKRWEFVDGRWRMR